MHALGRWLLPSPWKSRKQSAWVRGRERAARITVWVAVKEKEMRKRRGGEVVQSACGGVTVAVQQWVRPEERPRVFSKGKGEKDVV